jgi:hypothetical protein
MLALRNQVLYVPILAHFLPAKLSFFPKTKIGKKQVEAFFRRSERPVFGVLTNPQVGRKRASEAIFTILSFSYLLFLQM